MTSPADPADDPFEDQQLLVESSLPLVFETYDAGVEEGAVDPLVLLLDCEDELGGQIARGWLGDEMVDDAIADNGAGDEEDDASDAVQTTVFARAIAWADARGEISEAFPYLAEAFTAGPPSDGVMVVGITAGGASAFTAPWDARE